MPSRRSHRNRRSKRSARKRSPKKGSRISSKSSRRGLKLLSIKRSPKKDKKYMATFSRDGRIKKVHFGARGMSDYTKHKDSARKTRYINRHRKRENWADPTSPGALSRYILWGKPSFRESVTAYKRRFHL
jgi:hypothetical protein